MTHPPQLVWLRRDLRLHDHAAFSHALTVHPSAPIQAVFVFDSGVLARFTNPNDRRLGFIARALCQLHEQLKALGGGLLVLHGDAKQVIPALASAIGAVHTTCAADYEPATMQRDRAVAKAHGESRFSAVLDHLIFDPHSVLKDDGTPYKVYTPYSKCWRARLPRNAFDEKPVALQGRLARCDALAVLADNAGLKRLNVEGGAEVMLSQIGYTFADDALWPVQNVRAKLHAFVQQRVADYHVSRDFPAQEYGTSRLSPYLRHGLVSVRECARAASDHGDSKGHFTWMSELIWREFYSHILYHFPESMHSEFQPQYRNLLWEQDAQRLDLWKNGQTGFPIIDAAMRELLQTGYMHNRARMIVASFMTKDLHLDWRLGEEHFAQHLMDYELASNVGGWQWAASTGTDAQPYFRIFNPLLQSKRFDQSGEYIRRYVPELAALKGDAIHAPHTGKDLFTNIDYPAPMVDHATEKDKAIAMFKLNVAHK